MQPAKSNILKACINLQQTKVDKLNAMVETLNDSAVNSDKCVVGDKHHTFRAQTQNEQELYAKQLSAAINELNTLILIPKHKQFNNAETIGGNTSMVPSIAALIGDFPFS